MKTIVYSHYRKWYTPNICVKVPRLVYKEYIETNLIINFEFLCWTFSFVILSKRKKVDNKPKYKVVWKSLKDFVFTNRKVIKANTMWIARDKCGNIAIYTKKPIKYVDKFLPYDCDGCKLNSDMFPEVTFENSPKELIIKN